MTDIRSWSTAAASNNAASPNGFPEGMAPSGVNDSAREVMAAVRRWYEDAQWIDFGHGPNQTSATTFTVAGDLTAIYTDGRRIKCADVSTLFGTVTGSSYSNPSTTVTVSLDSGSLSGSLSAVALSLLTPANVAFPTIAIASGGTGATSAPAALANLGGVTSSRAINAGSGLSGGGDLSADRTLALSISGLTANSAPDRAADYVATYDADADANKKVLLNDLLAVPVVHVREEQTSGTDGGTFTSGAWRTRTLNTVKTNTISGASLSSNQISLPAGTYDIAASAPAYQVASHKVKLYNVTDSADVLSGTSERTASSGASQTRSSVFGRFTLAASKALEIRHICSVNGSLGDAGNFGVVEVYTEVMIRRVG